MWAIARRDLLAAFTTPLAWLVLACWLLLTDGIFLWTLSQVHGTPGSAAPLFVNTLSWGVTFLLLLAPALTMGAFSGERTGGTLQLLLTVPLREWDLVLGKFLGVAILLGALVLATLVQVVVLAFISAVHVPHLVAGYLGLLLVAAFMAALGTWISLLVDTPVAAYVITFAVLAVLLLLGVLAGDGPLGSLGSALGLTARAAPFFAGEIRLGNTAYFLGGTAAFLILTHGALRARRLHG